MSTDAGGGATPELLWETSGFLAPESVVFDPQRQQLHVSNLGTWAGGAGGAPSDGLPVGH